MSWLWRFVRIEDSSRGERERDLGSTIARERSKGNPCLFCNCVVAYFGDQVCGAKRDARIIIRSLRRNKWCAEPRRFKDCDHMCKRPFSIMLSFETASGLDEQPEIKVSTSVALAPMTAKVTDCS